MANIMIDKVLTGSSSIPAAIFPKIECCFMPKADVQSNAYTLGYIRGGIERRR